MSLDFLTSRLRAVVIGLLVLAVVFAGYRTFFASGTRTAVAYFDSATSIYPNDKVKVLGMTVGEIASITPEDDRVRIEFTYDSDVKLPADVKAAIVSPTLVATRFLQLAPAYTGGPTLSEDGEIPQIRTAAPLEFDDLKSELSRISKELGPQKAGEQGALAEFLSVSAKAGKGRGTQFNTMVTELSSALKTVSEGRGDLFGTVRNLQVFVSALAQMDTDIVTFNQRLAGVSDVLDDNGQDLAAAIKSINTASGLVTKFLAENRPGLQRSTQKLTQLTTTLAASRDDLATVLHVGPNTLTNFGNIYSTRANGLTGQLWFDNLETPGSALCTLIEQQMTMTGQPSPNGCSNYLAPLLDELGIPTPPIGVGPPINQPQPTPQPGDPQIDGGNGNLGGLLGLLLPGGIL
jgi:phospholipid/cholesterol/gamma-HCH transport system substrate-binding protein